MPYKIIERDNQYCVCKQSDDNCSDPLGCHDTRDKANSQMRALYASEDDKQQKRGADWQYMQSETNYTVTPDTGNGQVCANCRFYRRDSGYPCAIVRDDPLPIVPSGWCNQWSAIRRGSDTLDMLMEAVGDELAQEMTANGSGLRMTNGKSDSKFDFIGWFTNNFQDREAEYISAKAIGDFIDRVNRGNSKLPELWFGHLNGTRHGQVKKLYQVGHFCIAAGTFDSPADNPLVAPMKKWYATMESQGYHITMSHSFLYDPAQKRNGVYHHFEPFEVSSLVTGVEANPYTYFETI